MEKTPVRERQYFEENESKIRRMASEGMVLLENRRDTLPLPLSEKNIALFGGGAVRTVYGGGGSAITLPRRIINISDAFKNAGYQVVSEKGLSQYNEEYERAWEILNRFMQLPGFAQAMALEYYRPGDLDIPDEDFDEAAKKTDTAVYVLSRMIGEGWDRRREGSPVKPLDETFIKAATELYVGAPQEKGGDHHTRALKFAELTEDYFNNSYELTEIEKSNLTRMVKRFKRTVLLLNTGGVIDMKFIRSLNDLGAVLLVSYGGMEAGNAVCDLLTGKASPSGKLTDTWAENYEDNPASAFFSKNGDGNSLVEQYTEGIYVGYRYFDTFGVRPVYEFGFGRSYTDFSMEEISVDADETAVTVRVTVKNSGSSYTGKEVVQVYYSAPDGELGHPYQELAGFAKTDELKPGEAQTIEIRFPLSQMASYSEKRAAFILEAGDYIIRVGNSSRNTYVAAVLNLDAVVITEQLINRLDKGELTELRKNGATPYTYEGEAREIAVAKMIRLSAEKIPLRDTAHNGFAYGVDAAVTFIVGSEESGPRNPADRVYMEQKQTAKRKHRQIVKYVRECSGAKFADVINGKLTIEEFVAQMSLAELGAFVNFEKFDDEMMERLGIPTPPQYDGPAGIRMLKEYAPDGSARFIFNKTRRSRIPNEYTRSDQPEYLYCSAWPSSILMAQTWNAKLNEELGEGFSVELAERGVDVILAPGLNIHRDPLCGRSFEYYAEDPVLSGIMALHTVRGIQDRLGYGACVKHIAVNNQEADRYTSNSVLSERTIREIYLKGFSMVIRGSRPLMIMTSYNLINGEHASECFDLCTDIIRGEWAYKGLIRTDGLAGENHDLSMYAGNEWISYIGAYRTIIRSVNHKEYDAELDSPLPPLTPDDETIYLGDVQKCAALILRYIMYTHTVESLGVKRVPYFERGSLEDYLTARTLPAAIH